MNTSILLSIHPQFVEQILSGEKRFEYRTKLPLRTISRIFIYATSPYKKCVAVAEIEGILEGTPSHIWQKTKYAAGISRTNFMDYFRGHKKAYAYKIGRIYRVIQTNTSFVAPQSFRYLSQEQLKCISIEKKAYSHDNTIFVAGIHGIGKSTFLTNYITPLGFTCTSASNIIKKMNGNVPINKKIIEIDRNQQLLINGISEYKKQYCQLAIDGHFVLLNENNEFTEIDEEIFKTISPSVIILLTTTSPSIVKKQLLKRDPQNSWSLSFIQCFLRKERKAAFRMAKSLNIPLIIFDIKNNYKLIVYSLKKIINEKYQTNSSEL